MNTEQPAALAPGIAPPQQIHLGDLLLRSWQPEDLVPRFDAVTASFDHLHPWMDWLAEPMTLEQHRAFGDAMATSWPSPDGSCNYGIFDVDGPLLGAIGIHDRIGPRTLEIGYWCHVAHTGRGIITRSAAALTRIALDLPGVDRVEIRCDEANVHSAAVPRRLGYRLDRVAPREVRAPAESGRGMFWIKDNFPASRPVARSEHG
ncbi:GNAT family N-acetyltransferase [Nocardia vinacea]|uniref:GNAT family N-acetyltransferase n=1 Tax=Nocardia vinacea TaxID=96468 RepID=UPI0002E4F990|nr:GNAT family N-acetyltransferase [Nocardia vinacea]